MTLTIKSVLIASGIILSGMGLTGALAYAQGSGNSMALSINNEGDVRLAGTVESKTDSSILVSSWLGTWTVDLSENTEFSSKSESSADINVGDRVMVLGSIGSEMNIEAKSVKSNNNSLMSRIRALVGITSNVDANEETLTLETKNRGDVDVKTDSSTNIFIRGVSSVFANLSDGMRAIIRGTVNSDNNIQADVIRSPGANGDSENNNESNSENGDSENDNGNNGSSELLNINISGNAHLNQEAELQLGGE